MLEDDMKLRKSTVVQLYCNLQLSVRMNVN